MLCLSFAENENNPEKKQVFENYICILSILAQVAIDNAKRESIVTLNDEISKIKKDIGNIKYPKSWKIVKERSKYKQDEDQKEDMQKKMIEMNCPLDYIVSKDFELPKAPDKRKQRSIKDYIVPFDETLNDKDRKKYKRILEKEITDYIEAWKKSHNIKMGDDEYEYALQNIECRKLIRTILYKVERQHIDLESLSGYLIHRTFIKEKPIDISALLKVLYSLDNGKSVLAWFKREDQMEKVQKTQKS